MDLVLEEKSVPQLVRVLVQVWAERLLQDQLVPARVLGLASDLG